MKKSSPSSVSLAKLSNIWKRWEILPISTLLAAQCHHLPQPRNPQVWKETPLCVQPCTQTKPQLLPVPADPSLCPAAPAEPGKRRLRNRRWRSGPGLRAHRAVSHCTSTHLPQTHLGRCRSHLQRNTRVGWTRQCWLHQPPFAFWISSAYSLWMWAWEKGCAHLLQGSSLPAALTQLLCPAGLAPEVLAPLTFLPVAERIPGLAQVASEAIVHNSHMAGATAGVGVGCGVSSCAIVQPTHQAKMESHLEEENQ